MIISKYSKPQKSVPKKQGSVADVRSRFPAGFRTTLRQSNVASIG